MKNVYDKVRLGDICEKGASNIAQKNLDENTGHYPVFGASGFIKNVDFYQQDTEYIAIVKDGAGIGRAMILPAKSSVISTMQYIFPKQNINIKYLFYTITFINLAKYFSGSTIPHIYFRDYQKELIPLPTYSEQLKIVSILDRISNLATLRKSQINRLNLLVKSRFVEMFGDPVRNEKGWEVKRLGSLSSLITKGASPNWQGFEYTIDSNQTLFVTSENVREGFLFLEQPKYIENAFNDKQKRSILSKGDFLINIVGASIGRAAQFTLDVKANINQAVALVRLNMSAINEHYLLYFLNSPKAIKMYEEMQVSVARANLSLQNISDLEVLFPPLTLQNQFAAFVEQVDKSQFVLRKGLDNT